MSNSSIWPIDRNLSGTTSPGQSLLGNNENKEILPIPQISKARALPSEGLLSYPGYLHVGVAYFSAEMQSVYSTALADLTEKEIKKAANKENK